MGKLMKSLVKTADIITALGYPNTSASEEILKQASAIAAQCNQLIAPAYISKSIKIDSIIDDQVVLETGETFCDQALADELKPCSHVLITVMTIGKPLDDAIAHAFADDDYLSGVMLDAAGTSAVSNYSRQLWQSFIASLDDDEGITQGFCPGEKGWNLTAQKTIFNLLDTTSIGVELNENCLMIPAKSLSTIYGIGKDIPISKTGHNCAKCEFKNCMMRDNREVSIKVHRQGETLTIQSPVGRLLIDVLREHDIYIDAPCGGQGKCGACKAKFIKLPPKITSFDASTLTKQALAEGWRLTCQTIIEHPLEVILDTIEKMTVLTVDDSSSPQAVSKTDAFGIAIDIGTTTVVAFLINLHTGAIIDRVADMNHQRQYGADVASRILYGMQNVHGNQRLQETITTQLNTMIKTLKNEHSITEIKQVVVAANTVMTHILLGYDTKSLGVAPYTPVSISRESVPCHTLNIDCDCPLTVMEGIAAYVGSDITVGAAEVALMDDEQYSLLLDLGTNGEMVLANKHHAFCCSTAAGPAFEAANIHCGMGGVTGAISESKFIRLSQNKYQIKNTIIGNGVPRGICGSGVLDITAQLAIHGLVDPSGRMDTGTNLVKEDETVGRYVVIDQNVIFTQKDVREIQLSKAAIAAGIRVLFDTANITFSDIKNVYIAGGFGNYMSIDSALTIKLLPNALANKIKSVGNTAAKGAIHALISEDFCNTIACYAQSMDYIELSTNMDFQNYFIEEMRL